MANQATCQAKTRSIQLYDIEVGSTKTELLNLLAQELQTDPKDLASGDIKSSARSSTLVVSMDAQLIPRALQIRSLGGGWPLARIREMVDPEFCDKCQIFGHSLRQCNSSTQNEKRCINCSQTGHLRTACPNEPACFVCNMENHRMNSMACPHFRRIVHQIRKRHKQNEAPLL